MLKPLHAIQTNRVGSDRWLSNMGRFKILVEGRNCLLDVDGISKKCGFFTTRMVNARDAQDSVRAVSELIRKELIRVALNDAADPPTMEVAELSEVGEFDEDPPRGGFTWYVEDENGR